MNLRYATLALATLLFALLSAINASAQYRPNVVIWDEKSKCGSSKLADQRSKVKCGSERYGSGKILTIEVPGIRLSVYPYRGKEVLSVRAKIENKADDPLLIDPSTWSVASYVTEEDFKSGKAPLLNETSYARETRRADSSATPQIVVPLTGSPLDAQAPTRRITSTGSAETPRTPNKLPESAQRSVVTGETGNVGNSMGSPNVTVTITRQPSAFKDVSLIRSEIAAGKMESGATYFNLVETSSFQLAIIHIGDYSFVFAIR